MVRGKEDQIDRGVWVIGGVNVAAEIACCRNARRRSRRGFDILHSKGEINRQVTGEVREEDKGVHRRE
jgi:hypothetical protein